MNRLLHTLLYCIIPTVVYATPSARDAYEDSLGSDFPPIIYFIILAAVFYCGYKDGGGVALGLKYVFYIICAALLFVFGMGIFVSITAVIANNIWLLGLIPVAIIIFANWSK